MVDYAHNPPKINIKNMKRQEWHRITSILGNPHTYMYIFPYFTYVWTQNCDL